MSDSQTANWLKVGLALVQALAATIIWMRERQLIDLGAQKAIADALRAHADVLAKADEAIARVDAARRDGRLRDLANSDWTAPDRKPDSP